jgi:hypothetical protein
MRIISIIFLLGTLSVLPIIGAGAEDLDGQLQKIKIGMEQDAAVSLMGSSPDGKVDTNTLSINHSRLVWQGKAGRLYVITTLFNRVVRMKSCSGVPASEC